MTDGEMIFYRAAGGTQAQLRAIGGTMWPTQAQIAELYGRSMPNVVQTVAHTRNDSEFDEATINSELIVRTEVTQQALLEFDVARTKQAAIETDNADFEAVCALERNLGEEE